MKKFPLILTLILISAITLSATVLPELIDELVKTDDKVRQQEIIEDIVSAQPSTETVVSLLENITFPKPKETGVITEELLCIDGATRPFCWYIPECYDPSKRVPLLVYLHGGVSRKEIIEDPEAYAKESPFIPLADKKGYILLFPFGQAGASWWDSVGVDNVLSQVRLTKTRFNIDDNRVFMTGFSDGASGSFFFGMCHPTDFAAFLPLNGHPGVGSIDGGIQTYFVNLTNRPFSVINTDEDALYPSEKMSPMMDLAISAGANMLYRIYRGIGHSFDYAQAEIPLMDEYMNTHPREPHPIHIIWETVEKRHGRCMWLSLDAVKPDSIPDWYTDHNMELIDERIVFGFYPDETHEGKGIRIDKVVDSTFVALAGAQEGDIIIAVEGDSVTGMEVISDYKATKQRGDSGEFTVLRDGKTIEFKGYFPPPTVYDLFRREQPSARAIASFSANQFRVQQMQLGAFTLYIHPSMIQADQPVRILVNGTQYFDEVVEPDIAFLLRNFLKFRDRELLYINRISINTQ